MSNDPEFLTVAELADKLRISVPMVRELIDQHRIPVTELGSKTTRIYWEPIKQQLRRGRPLNPHWWDVDER